MSSWTDTLAGAGSGAAMGSFAGPIGSVLGALVGAGASYFGNAATNKQNMMMNTGAFKAQQISQEASALGVSPLALLGNTGQNIPMQSATYGDFTGVGQNLGRAAAAVSSGDERMQALQEQQLLLLNAKIANDVVAGQMKNSVNRAALAQPSTYVPSFSLDDVWQSVYGRGELSPKASVQPFFRSEGSVFYGPSAAVQQSLWSPLPGLPANPAAAGEVTSANARNMPVAPDVARMSGFPPGAYPFLPGTAPSWYQRYLAPETEGRSDPAIYGSPW